MTGILMSSMLAAAGNSSDSEMPASLMLVILLGVIVLVMFVTFANRYKRCPANRILVVYGKTGSGASKCIHGGAAFIMPLFQAYDFLDLEPFVVPIDLSNALSQENIRVAVPTTVTAAISNQAGVMQNAAVRLLGLSRQQIMGQAQDIILGQMRAVIATMKIEEINQDRQAFMGRVNEAVSFELEKIGLQVINVNIRDIGDESGYIEALGRKAAAEAINQANVDVAEQEKRGQIGVAERQRDNRVAVAAANSAADIGEASASRDRRQKTAMLDAEAVRSETEANGQKASYVANQNVAEQLARQKAESASKEADGAIRVAQELAQKKAEDARALRNEAQLKADLIVPAEADKQKIIIDAEAQREQYVRVAKGQAEATLLKMQAEGQGINAILEGKATGYRDLVGACGTSNAAASLLVVEKFQQIAEVQAKAIQNLPIEKIFVWDGGGENGGMKNLGSRLMGALPPMHELAKMVGLELPDFLGKLSDNSSMAPKPEEKDKSDKA